MKRLIAAALALPVIAVVGVAAAGASPPDDLQAVKAATARYHSLTQAEMNGYVAASPCVASPAGVEGIHYDNRDLMADPAIDPLRPEVLVYLPKQNGRLQLVGVEYWQVALANTPSGPAPWFGAAAPPGGFSTPSPVLFGQRFDGPMQGHGPGMPWHYDLHVWLWEDNPAGMFTAFNPALACP